MLDPTHPIFHNLLKVTNECFIKIFERDGNFWYTYEAPSDPKTYRRGRGDRVGYSATLKNAEYILKMWPPTFITEIQGPMLSPVCKKIREMELRYKKRMEYKTLKVWEDELAF